MAMGEEKDGERVAKKARLKSPIGLGEAAALLSVTIAGLGLYVSYSQWAENQKDKQAAQQQAKQRAQVQTPFLLRGDGRGGQIRLESVHSDQVIQSQTFYFPAPIRSGSIQITGGGHVDAGWFAEGLKKALKGAADNAGERDLPVGVSTVFVEDGDTRTDNSLYQVGFSIHSRMLQAAVVDLEGIALSRRGVAGDLHPAVDAAWARQAPAKPHR
jgi:hypothetical protein